MQPVNSVTSVNQTNGSSKNEENGFSVTSNLGGLRGNALFK